MDASILSSSTLVPVGSLAALVALVFWLARLWSDVQSLKNDRSSMQDQLKSTNGTVYGISDRMIRLEEKSDRIIEKLDELKKRMDSRENAIYPKMKFS